MIVRLKRDHSYIRHASKFNPVGLSEVLTGDDSIPIRDLEVAINGEWKDMAQAFKDRDIIPDDLNNCFGQPPTPEDRLRGYLS